MPGFLPVELADWVALQEGGRGTTPNDLIDCVAAEVERVARRLVEEVTGLRLPATDEGLLPYTKRIWRCVECHWRRFAEGGPIRLADVISRLESGQLALDASRSSNVIREVVIAQGMELREQKAAVMFDIEYMPIVRAIALRVGGAQAAEHFRNFAADLILPNQAQVPPIAKYLGRAPMTSWLRLVIRNAWIDHGRKRVDEQASESVVEVSVPEASVERIDAGPCRELMQPIFAQAVASLKTEDRVMLKMLFLDEVPQKELARSLGIHSGNVTRRRDNAAAQVFGEVRRLSLVLSNPRQGADCLDLLLAWNQPELAQRLGELLTSSLRAAHMEQQGSAKPHGRGEPS